jgi:hypothetical protein
MSLARICRTPCVSEVERRNASFPLIERFGYSEYNVNYLALPKDEIDGGHTALRSRRQTRLRDDKRRKGVLTRRAANGPRMCGTGGRARPDRR